MSRLRQAELDLVFGRLAEPSDMIGLEFEHLFSEALVAAARPGHPLARKRNLPPPSLDGLPLVLPTTGTAIRRTIDTYLVTHGVSLPSCVIETLDTTFALKFVRGSDAVWFLPAGLVNGLSPTRLAVLHVDTRDTIGPVGITTRRDHELSEGAAALASAFRAASVDHTKRERRSRTKQRRRSGASAAAPRS